MEFENISKFCGLCKGLTNNKFIQSKKYPQTSYQVLCKLKELI